MRSTWKQLTPAMQYCAIIGNLDGVVDNFANGIYTKAEMLERVNLILDELRDLTPYLEHNSWGKRDITPLVDVLKSAGLQVAERTEHKRNTP